MDNYAAQVAKLGEETLQNVTTDWRSLKGTISVKKDKFLCVALPWLRGWSAYVDGKEVKLYRANTGLMGVELSAGEHNVELRYWLPGLTIGLILSGIGLCCLVFIATSSRRE